MLDKHLTSQTPFFPQGDADSAARRVRHSANPPPVALRELEDAHESQAPAGSAPGQIHETSAGLRMRASLSTEIGKPAPQD